MAEPHRLSPADARRLAVRAQRLTAERPTELLPLVRHLTGLQVEPTSAVAPSADVVLWSRLGPGYDPDDLTDAVDSLALVQLDSVLVAAEDVALHRAVLADWPAEGGPARGWHDELRAWVAANDGCRREVLELLRTDGPLPAAALPDTCEVPWRSSGWNNQRSLNRLLVQLARRGEIAVAGYADGGRDKLWDLAGRIYPDDPVPALDDALHELAARRLRSLGLARSREADDAGEPAVVDGVRGRWRVDPDLLATLDEAPDGPQEGRAALLSPLDRLVFDRKRMAELFDFDYQLEMYKPAASRRWGYWALPVLAGSDLVGKVDATADHAEGELRVDAVHRDPGREAEWERWGDAVDAELEALGAWLGLPVVRVSAPARGG